MIKWFKHTFFHKYGKSIHNPLYGPFECLQCNKLHWRYRK